VRAPISSCFETSRSVLLTLGDVPLLIHHFFKPQSWDNQMMEATDTRALFVFLDVTVTSDFSPLSCVVIFSGRMPGFFSCVRTFLPYLVCVWVLKRDSHFHIFRSFPSFQSSIPCVESHHARTLIRSRFFTRRGTLP
jgi:hypothetical protein